MAEPWKASFPHLSTLIGRSLPSSDAARSRRGRLKTCLVMRSDPAVLLAIETSCDETAAAVVTSDLRVLSSVVASQAGLHAEWGGVVPEVASREHVAAITGTV